MMWATLFPINTGIVLGEVLAAVGKHQPFFAGHKESEIADPHAKEKKGRPLPRAQFLIRTQLYQRPR